MIVALCGPVQVAGQRRDTRQSPPSSKPLQSGKHVRERPHREEPGGEIRGSGQRLDVAQLQPRAAGPRPRNPRSVRPWCPSNEGALPGEGQPQFEGSPRSRGEADAGRDSPSRPPRRPAMRRTHPILAVLASSSSSPRRPREAAPHATGCGVQTFAYAGLEADSKAHGVSATLDTTVAPAVTDGHVGGWIGARRRRRRAGRGRRVAPDRPRGVHRPTTRARCTTRSRCAGSAAEVRRARPRTSPPGVSHQFAVLEMTGRNDWWRVWVDGNAGQPADPPARQPRRLVPAGRRRELERRHGRLQHLLVPLLERRARPARTAACGARSARATRSRIPATTSCRSRRRRAASSRRAWPPSDRGRDRPLSRPVPRREEACPTVR